MLNKTAKVYLIFAANLQKLMDFETWLYIFFIAISIIVPIVKKAYKKNNPPPENMEEEVVEENVFESLKEQFTRYQQASTTSQPQVVTQQEDDFLNYDDEAIEKNYQEATKVAEYKPVFTYDDVHSMDEQNYDAYSLESNEEEEAGNNYNEKSETYSFKFDPVDAIIYSEILKRPEY